MNSKNNSDNTQAKALNKTDVMRILIKELKIRVKHDYKESTKTEKEFTVFLEFEGEIISESDFTVFL